MQSEVEIDRQISIRLQEIEFAKVQRKPQLEPPTPLRVEPASVGSTTNKKEDRKVVLNTYHGGESAPVESPGQQQRTQHLPHHQQTTPVSRKPKKGQQNQRYGQRQTQLNWNMPQRQTQPNWDMPQRQTQHNQDPHMQSNALQNQRITQHHWDPHAPAYVPQGYDTGQRRGYQPHHHSRQNYFDQRNPPRQNQQRIYDNYNQHQFGQHWMSTPRDPNSRHNYSNLHSLSGETTMNNSLLNILDTQCKVQQETTQALSTII